MSNPINKPYDVQVKERQEYLRQRKLIQESLRDAFGTEEPSVYESPRQIAARVQKRKMAMSGQENVAPVTSNKTDEVNSWMAFHGFMVIMTIVYLIAKHLMGVEFMIKLIPWFN